MKASACERVKETLNQTFAKAKAKLYKNIKNVQLRIQKLAEQLIPSFSLEDNGLDCAISAAHPREPCVPSSWNYSGYYSAVPNSTALEIPIAVNTSVGHENRGRLFTANELFLHFFFSIAEALKG